MQATWNNKVIAEADKEDLIYIEGNWYFPPRRNEKRILQPQRQTHHLLLERSGQQLSGRCRWRS